MKALSENAVYGLAVLHVLMRAEKPLEPGTLSITARVPAVLFKSILSRLVRAGLVQRLGRKGYLLAKAPGKISLENILAALENPVEPSAPCGGDFESCPSRASCVLAVLCRRAHESFRDVAREFTLEDLRESAPDLPNCMDPAVRAKEGPTERRHGCGS